MALQFRAAIAADAVFSGFAADHFQPAQAPDGDAGDDGCAPRLILGLLTVTGLVQLWHVYVFAFPVRLQARALDAPVRQTFVAELVGDGRSVERDRASTPPRSTPRA